MPALTDVRFDALRALGFTGATSDMLLQWLQANGATSSSVPDAWNEMLAVQLLSGNTGQRSDDWRQLLATLGYAALAGSAQVNDMELAFWEAGGTFGPPPPPEDFYWVPDGDGTLDGQDDIWNAAYVNNLGFAAMSFVFNPATVPRTDGNWASGLGNGDYTITPEQCSAGDQLEYWIANSSFIGNGGWEVRINIDSYTDESRTVLRTDTFVGNTSRWDINIIIGQQAGAGVFSRVTMLGDPPYFFRQVNQDAGSVQAITGHHYKSVRVI